MTQKIKLKKKKLNISRYVSQIVSETVYVHEFFTIEMVEVKVTETKNTVQRYSCILYKIRMKKVLSTGV